jgi:hypothetical protein
MLQERLVVSFKERLNKEATLAREEAKILPGARAMRSITDASSVQGNPVQQTAAVIPDRAREAQARLQISDVVQITAGSPKKQEARAQRQQKIAKRRVARPVLRVARQPQYAWFGGRMWW